MAALGRVADCLKMEVPPSSIILGLSCGVCAQSLLAVHRRTYGTAKGHVGPGITFICWCVALRRIICGAALPHASSGWVPHSLHFHRLPEWPPIPQSKNRRRGAWWTFWVLWTYLRGGADRFRARSWYGPKKVRLYFSLLCFYDCEEVSNRNGTPCFPVADDHACRLQRSTSHLDGEAELLAAASPASRHAQCTPTFQDLSNAREAARKCPHSWCYQLLNELLGLFFLQHMWGLRYLEPFMKVVGPLIISYIELYGDHDQLRLTTCYSSNVSAAWA